MVCVLSSVNPLILVPASLSLSDLVELHLPFLGERDLPRRAWLSVRDGTGRKTGLLLDLGLWRGLVASGVLAPCCLGLLTMGVLGPTFGLLPKRLGDATGVVGPWLW